MRICSGAPIVTLQPQPQPQIIVKDSNCTQVSINEVRKSLIYAIRANIGGEVQFQ